MARNYGKKNPIRRNRNVVGQLTLMCVIFVAGYVSASLYDFTRLSGWVNTHVLLQQAVPAAVKPVTLQAQLPKPNFEFYTLLANERVAGSPQVARSSPVMTLPTAPIIAAISTAPVPVTLETTQKLPLHEPLVAAAVEVKTSNPRLVTKDSYLVQVASFKNLREAERMKISLVMKGFDVHLATVTQQRINWYRVIIGPFASRQQAQKAQVSFARSEHIMGMIRKMDA